MWLFDWFRKKEAKTEDDHMKYLIVGLGNIGDEYVDGLPYETVVKIAKDYIDSIGGFEKFAEWGFIR